MDSGGLLYAFAASFILRSCAAQSWGLLQRPSHTAAGAVPSFFRKLECLDALSVDVQP